MELWDLYDEQKNITGKVHERGKEILGDYYHLVVHVWIKNKEGKYLISRRSSNRKSYPLYLECQGGSVLKGEDSFTGAKREVLEEVGIDLSKATTDEVCEVKWMSIDEIKEIYEKGELVPTLTYIFEFI